MVTFFITFTNVFYFGDKKRVFNVFYFILNVYYNSGWCCLYVRVT